MICHVKALGQAHNAPSSASDARFGAEKGLLIGGSGRRRKERCGRNLRRATRYNRHDFCRTAHFTDHEKQQTDLIALATTSHRGRKGFARSLRRMCRLAPAGRVSFLWVS